MQYLQRGVNLIELMIIVIVLGVSLSIAVPSWNAFTSSNNLTSYTNDLVSAMTIARSEAIVRRTDISLIAANSNWTANGWQVVDDANNNGIVDAGELLRDYSSISSNTITMTNNIIGNDRVISIDRRGLLASPTNVFTFDVCENDKSGETGRQLEINVAGRVSLNPNFICP